MQAERSSRSTDPRFALGYFALAPLYLAPLVVTRFLPAFDLPHHLAIADALAKSGRPDSPYARAFTVGLELAPFDLHFVALGALSGLVSLATAAKLLVGAQVLALPLACARLLSAAGRSTWPALLAFPLAYSMPLHYGLVAFVLALPLMLWFLAESVDGAAWSARPRRQALLAGALALALFFTHLEAWAVGLAGGLVAILLQPAPRRVRAVGVVALLPSVVPCALYLGRVTPSPLKVLVSERARELATNGVVHDLFSRFKGLPVHLLRGFTDRSDLTASYLIFGLIALAALAGLRRPALTPSAAPIAVGFLAYFGLPHHALPHAYSVYPRFAVVLAALALLLVPGKLCELSARARTACAGAVGLAVALWGLVLVHKYSEHGRELADFEELMRQVPAGLASGGLVFDAESRVIDVGGLFTGVPAYYVSERAAPTSSTWLYYCTWPQLPCRMKGPDAPLPFFSHPDRFDPRRALLDLELILVRGGPPAEKIFGTETPRVRLVAAHGSWRAFARR